MTGPVPDERTSLLRELDGIAAQLAGLDLHDPAACQRALTARVPAATLARVRALLEAGIAAGWLVPKENGGIRFGRVAKDLRGFTVDAVLMDRAGPRHRHPNGEIDLLFARRGTPEFDGHPEGWAVYPPGSTHVPAVSDGEMVILYFLPGGAIEWT
jgi:hypothetical protein